jgi:beta-lactamase superfamily II metal-dependent hydrolase
LGVCVSLGLLTVLLGSVWIPAALPFAGANYLALTGLIRLAELSAHVPAVTTPRPTLLFLLCAALAVVLATHARQNQRARATLLMLVLSWANLTLWPDLLLPRRLEAVFLDVEQGDSVFLRLPDGGTMLVDAGMRSRRLDFGERVVVPYLRHHNVKRLDVVVASHPHADHIGGLVHMLEQVEVGHYVDSGQLYDTWTARRIPELLLQRGVVYYRVAAGDCLAGLGGVGGFVLHPTEAFVTDQGQSPQGLNNGSVVLQLSYGGRRILFTGDVEAETEPALQGWGQRLRADVLKAAHHGSRTSSAPLSLDAVHPGVAIISVGAFNKFGHPEAEVLQRLQQQGTRIYCTDHCGAISVAIEGDGTMQVGAVVNETCGGL